MVEAKKVFLKYPDGTMALKDINFQVVPGDIVYITGPSGSGKTSLLKLLMGVEYPTEGVLSVLGQPIAKGQESGIRRLRTALGPVFQEFRLIKGRSALENVMLGMRFLDIPKSQLVDYARDAIKNVGLENKSHSYIENLSWGECQRIAIARAVARKPALILADEPTGNLDKDNALKILALLTSFKDKSTAVIITTHATHLIGKDRYTKHIQVEKGTIDFERLGVT